MGVFQTVLEERSKMVQVVCQKDDRFYVGLW